MISSLAQSGKGRPDMTGTIRPDRPTDGVGATDLHPGLYALPGSISSFVAVAPNGGNGPMPAFSTQKYRHRPAPKSSPAARVAASSMGWDRGCVFSPGRSRGFFAGQVARENLSLTKRHEPGSFALREGSDVFPRHVQKHEGNHAREVGKNRQEFGNVCRVGA